MLSGNQAQRAGKVDFQFDDFFIQAGGQFTLHRFSLTQSVTLLQNCRKPFPRRIEIDHGRSFVQPASSFRRIPSLCMRMGVQQNDIGCLHA